MASSSSLSPLPMSQSALLLSVVDGPDGKAQLEYSLHSEVNIDSPGPGEVLIRVQSAALNPLDWKMRSYGPEIGMMIISDGYPAVMGTDIAGDVVGLGEGVIGFQMGDRVFCQSEFKKKRGGFQQYVAANACRVSKIPDNITYDGASTLPMGLTTAYSGLFSQFPTGLGLDSSVILDATRGGSRQYAQIPILVLGGSSSVGQYVIQLARLAGFSPIITSSSLAHTSALLELGATHVLDRSLSLDALQSSITSITSVPISFVYDCISTFDTQTAAVGCLAKKGRAVLTDRKDERLKGIDIEGKEVGMAIAAVHLPHNVGLLEPFYHDVLYGLLESGVLVPNRYEVLSNGLGGVVDGLKRLEANKVSRLKLVANPQASVVAHPQDES